MKCIFKPIEAEYFIFREDSEITGPDWFGVAVRREEIFVDLSIRDGHVRVHGCSIRNHKDWMHARVGDMIVRLNDGTIFPVRSNKFKHLFDIEKERRVENEKQIRNS